MRRFCLLEQRGSRGVIGGLEPPTDRPSADPTSAVGVSDAACEHSPTSVGGFVVRIESATGDVHLLPLRGLKENQIESNDFELGLWLEQVGRGPRSTRAPLIHPLTC